MAPARRILYALAAAVLVAPLRVRGTCGPVLMQQSFGEYQALQTYTEADVVKDFPRVQLGESMKVNHCTVQDGRLTAHFPKGQILGVDTGCTWFTRFAQVQQEATLQYDVYFEPGFEWTAGGKLPGLCGGQCPRGCDIVDVKFGWSARLMWREDGAITLYAYYPGMVSNGCGQDFYWSKKLTTGRWHQINLHVKMNTPGVHNGVFTGYLDGELALYKNDFMWREADSTAYEMINNAYITTYVGGKSYDLFAPHQDQWIMFDSFKASSGFCPPGSANKPSPSPVPRLPMPPPQRPVQEPPVQPVPRPPPQQLAPQQPSPPPPPAPPPSTNCARKFQRCGGVRYRGPTCCEGDATCRYANPWYSQCV